MQQGRLEHNAINVHDTMWQVLSSLVKNVTTCRCVDVRVWGWRQTFRLTSQGTTCFTTNNAFNVINIPFSFLLPAELLDCLRAATCCSLVSLVMLSSSSSDRASAISPHLFNQAVSGWPLSLFSLWNPALPRENGVDSQHSESQQHGLFSRR